MKVNLVKTQKIVFRRGGIVKRCECWSYDGQPVKVVSQYKYLGLIFSSRLSWNPSKSNQSMQGKKALFQLKSLIRRLVVCPLLTHLSYLIKL